MHNIEESLALKASPTPPQLTLPVASSSVSFGSGPTFRTSAQKRQRLAFTPQQWIKCTVRVVNHVKSALRQVQLLERAGIGAVAGGLAGGFTNATLHPIDTVKTKLQMRGSIKLYSGPVDVVKKVLRAQGIAGFYSGLPAAIVGSFMSSSIYFGTYELGKGLLAISPRCPPALVPPLAAAVGNITSSAILVPKEVIKQRLQAGASGTALEVLVGTIRAEGVGGLYTGYSAALLRNLPANMINFSTFEYLKSQWLARSGKGQLAPWQSIISGATAGALSAALTTPLDVVKTRLMTQARVAVAAAGASGIKAEAAAKAQALANYTYTGVASTLCQVWREEGPRGLMRGMAPRLVYSACFSAVGFLSFETAKAFLLRRRQAVRERAARKERRSHTTERGCCQEDGQGQVADCMDEGMNSCDKGSTKGRAKLL